MLARDVMTRRIVSVRPHTAIIDAIGLMLQKRDLSRSHALLDRRVR